MDCDSAIWARTCDSAFLTSSQAVPLLQIQRPDFDKLGHRACGHRPFDQTGPPALLRPELGARPQDLCPCFKVFIVGTCLWFYAFLKEKENVDLGLILF